MSDEQSHKEHTARFMALFGMVKVLVKTHPNPDALKVAWHDVASQLGAFDQILSAPHDLGEDAEMSALLRREIERWTAEIHRTK